MRVFGLIRHRRPFDAAVRARQHARAGRRGQRPDALLRDHRFRHADQPAVAAIVHVDEAGLAAVDDARDHLAVLVAHVDEDRRARGVEVPDIVRDVLVVPLVLAGVEIDRDERIGIEIVAGANRAIQVRRRIADHEVHRMRLPVDGRRHPHAAAERAIEVAALRRKLLLLGRDVALHVAADRVVLGPHAFAGRSRESCRTSTAGRRCSRRTP